MAVPQNKAELLAAIESNFTKLNKVLGDVPVDAAMEASLDGHAKGTRMSVADLVAYLVGWNELVLKWLDRDAAGAAIDFPETGYQWNELGQLAQKFYCDYQSLPFNARVARLRAAKDEIMTRIEAFDDAALYGRPWYGTWTMGRMIQFNTSSPYENARRRLVTWRKERASL